MTFLRLMPRTWSDSSLKAALYSQSMKTFLTLQLSQYHKSGSTFMSSEPVAASSDCCLLWKCHVFVLAQPPSPSCAWALPKELCHWFCSQNHQLSSGTAFGSDCQMTSNSLNLYSNLNFAAWSMDCRGFICSETPKKSSINYVKFELFLEHWN